MNVSEGKILRLDNWRPPNIEKRKRSSFVVIINFPNEPRFNGFLGFPYTFINKRTDNFDRNKGKN